MKHPDTFASSPNIQVLGSTWKDWLHFHFSSGRLALGEHSPVRYPKSLSSLDSPIDRQPLGAVNLVKKQSVISEFRLSLSNLVSVPVMRTNSEESSAP